MRKRVKKLVKEILKKFSLTKREKLVIIIALLTFGLIAIQLSGPKFRYQLITGLVVATYILGVWGLREDIKKIEWLTLFILPTMYAAAVPLFYFLLPVRWLTRLPTAIFFAVGMYAIYLVENIYNVAAARTIQLLRAAYSVGLLLTLLTLFLFFSIIFSLHLSWQWNILLVFAVSFPLALQSLWVMKLEQGINRRVFLYTFIISLALSEFVFVFSFWPIQTVIEGLFLTTIFYSLVGIAQQYLINRLFRRSATEFISISLLVFLLVLLTTKWGVGE